MKKIFVFLFAAIFALSGCQNGIDELVEVQENGECRLSGRIADGEKAAGGAWTGDRRIEEETGRKAIMTEGAADHAASFFCPQDAS